MRRIKFEYPPSSPTNTVEFTWGLEMSAPTWTNKTRSPYKRSFDGTVYTQIKGISEKQIPLVIDLLTEDEVDQLIDFIDAVDGRYRTFKYTDQDSNEHTVKFRDEQFDFGDGTVPFSISLPLIEV